MKFSSTKIRNDFIKFFKDEEHKFVRSSPVLPIDDPTLLFTNAGMNQFKKIFLNQEKIKFSRAVNSQKCIRVSGKHNDLEEVGVDKFHHTFFEMLGNWSFGDYSKKEAIIWSWKLLTDIWKLDKNRLWVTVYNDDDESEKLWKKYTDVDVDRILRFGDKDNFWEMGETGPCGPCSEIHYYIGDLKSQNAKGVNLEQEYRELWNLVFIEYNRTSEGKLEKLPLKHVDTGMGLERIVSTLNNLDDHYKTDLFYPIIEKIIDFSGKDYSFENGIPHRVIADHIRMVSFSLADGIMPSNDGRGYVVRRVLRRACRFGRVLDIKEEFLYKLIDTVVEILGEAYSELNDKKNHIRKVVKSEEESFGKTLDRGLLLFEEICDNLSDDTISGDDVFKLYDTYGFPVDLTELLASEKQLTIDKKQFNELMENQKSKARSSNKFKSSEDNSEWIVCNEDIKQSTFIGYDVTESNNIEIIKYRCLKDNHYEVILNETPFYAESGGQIGDTGIISNDTFELQVNNTYFIGEEICHNGEMINGLIDNDLKVKAVIDNDKRQSIKLNHTATHLLHKALKMVLGSEVQQAGSLVSNDYLRFDLTYYKKIEAAQILEIEDIVNKSIRNNIIVNTELKPFLDAKREGAEALFGEKYGDEVRVVDVDGFSKELCGGTHVESTGQIGVFKIVSESSLAAGIRRIEAMTGASAFSFIRQKLEIVDGIKNIFSCNDEDLLDKAQNLNLLNKSLKKEIAELSLYQTEEYVKNIISDKIVIVNDIKLYIDTIKTDLNPQNLSDIIRKQLISKGIGLILINSKENNLLLCLITKDFSDEINAGLIIKKIAHKFGLGGGGSKFMAIMKIGPDVNINKSLKIGENVIKDIIGNL